ncbi:MAG: UbiD family decarboxylase [Kiritimatiellia bacterium]
MQTCWPGEPAPLITWPLVVTKGPSGSREDDTSLGIYRMQVLGKDPDDHALAGPRRRPAPPALEGRGPARALPACAVIGADPGTIWRR